MQRGRSTDAKDVEFLVRKHLADLLEAGQYRGVCHRFRRSQQVRDDSSQGDGWLRGQPLVSPYGIDVFLQHPANVDDRHVPVMLEAAIDLHRPAKASSLLVERHVPDSG